MTKKKNAVVKKDKNLPSTMVKDMQADAGKGSEGVDKDSLAIPFLAILQSNSPAVENESPKGAKSGMFMNTITEELYKEATIIPCGFQRKFVQWQPREDGGAFHGMHNPVLIDTGEIETYRDDKGLLRMKVGDDILKDTRIHYVMLLTKSGSYTPAVLSLSSTQIKKSKRFMSLIRGIEFKDEKGKPFNPPSFGNTYTVTTTREKNDMGSWFGVEFAIDKMVDNTELYLKCRKFSQDVDEGSVKTADPATEEKADDGKF
ncbi:hypothetical protein KAR91_21185 [Candidatus Pacearchaeota archaeon]|nr:hypothetical protein [Candidatus Pacearchaeota archaeon]